MSFGTLHTKTKQKRLANMLWLCECWALCGPYWTRGNDKFGNLVEPLVVTGHRYRAISRWLFFFFRSMPMPTSHVIKSSCLQLQLTVIWWCFELLLHVSESARLRIKCVRANISSYGAFAAILHHKKNRQHSAEAERTRCLLIAQGLFIRCTDDDNVHEAMGERGADVGFHGLGGIRRLMVRQSLDHFPAEIHSLIMCISSIATVHDSRPRMLVHFPTSEKVGKKSISQTHKR